MVYGLLIGIELLALGYSCGQSIPTSPCPDVFQYQVDSTGMWYALITVSTPQPEFSVKLHIEMAINAFLPSQYAGKIQLVENKNEVWRKLLVGDKQPVQYKLYFPLSWPIPVVKSITSNQNVVCEGNMLTKISLEHNLFPVRLNFSQNKNPNPNNPVTPISEVSNVPAVEQTTRQVQFNESRPPVTTVQQQPVYSHGSQNIPSVHDHIPFIKPPPSTVRPPPTSTTMAPSVHECGVSFTNTVPLIVNGRPTDRGEWPWLVAMYIKSPRPSLEFQCGGSLLSKNVVLTAAHCIKYTGKPMVKTQSIVLYMGKYNLQEWTEQSNQPRNVEQVHLHPDYNEEDLDADLAVMILKVQVEYTIYVQPICLWVFATDINHIVGQRGTVVGWGRDDTGSTTSVPQKVTMPIVSQDQCLLSKIEFAFFTSNRTFCAGSQDGSGPCSGDSGGGFMMNYRDGNQLRWYLRGVVHISLYDKVNQQCDLRNYLIYTDVAKFMDWVRQFVP